MDDDNIVLIVAGNHVEAIAYANLECLHRWRYVNSPSSVFGLKVSEVRYVGTWYTREDLDEIREVLDPRIDR